MWKVVECVRDVEIEMELDCECHSFSSECFQSLFCCC
jgi:hypothetical protein